ncbi:hypothetical protein SHIRM173S_00596 [Streptomyces hirsutus]
MEALRAGASGFLLKDAPANELVQAIRVVAAGEAMLTEHHARGCWTSTPRICRPATSRCRTHCTR